MKYYDISMPLDSKMAVWANEGQFKREERQFGDAIVSLLQMTSHMGTHVDAPKHFLGKGAGSVDRTALSRFIGPCRVVELKGGKGLMGLKAKKGERVLLKTSNSARRLLQKSKFVTDYESVDLATAKYLVKQKIALIGVDYLGVEAKSAPGHPVHKTLLKAGIVIVEGLDLSKIKPGRYNLAVLPMRIKNGDGAPARAILWK